MKESNESQAKRAKAATEHPDYILRTKEWRRVRDCMRGEVAIKNLREKYLPRPAGMSGSYASAYEDYIERAHFPLVCSYALQGVLGVIITKLPEFNIPKELEYLINSATKDGRSLRQLFLDVVVEIFITGRVPLVVDIDENNADRFCIIQYKAEDLINWKTATMSDNQTMQLAVLRQQRYKDVSDVFSQETSNYYKVMILEDGEYVVATYDENSVEIPEEKVIPQFFSTRLNTLPLIIAGSINNSSDIQPIPLIPVANCAIQMYRKEADLANSEFLSCNPTLCITGVESDDMGQPKNTPNVVGSSVLFALENPASRIFYTTTDTAALQHVKEHIKDLYEEAIRHGVSILDARKGIEAAEALRIRQATQSASIYSIYLSAVSAIRKCLELICTWGGYNKDDLDVDAPSTLTFGTPDADLIRELASGNTNAVYPLSTVHRYLISAGMLDQTVSFEEYVDLLMADQGIKRKLKAVMEAYGTTDLSFSTEETGDITTNTEDSGGKVNTNKTSKYSPVNNPGLEGL